MTNEMQEFLPYDPPPPPPAEHTGGYYSPWSADPTWGPPTWPPSQQPPRGSGFRRTALAVFAIACVGAGFVQLNIEAISATTKLTVLVTPL